MYYSLIGCFVTVLIGWIVSLCTSSKDDQYDEKLIHPAARWLASFCPGKKRQYNDKSSSEDVYVSENGISTVSSVLDDNFVVDKSPGYFQDISLESKVYTTRM